MASENKDETPERAVRQFLRAIGRRAIDDHVERVVQFLARLHSCGMTPETEMGFRLIVQAWRNSGQTDAQARETAQIQLAVMVADGDLQIGENLLLVTEQGRLWLEREAKAGRGNAN